MSQKLGRVEKPEAAQYGNKRKVYLVPLIMAPQEPPADFAAILERYWSGADDGVQKLEWRIGDVKYVFMETVDRSGEGGIKLAEQRSPGAAGLAERRVDRGASFIAMEDPETFAEVLDWERCLYIGLISRKVYDQVSQSFQDASRRRYEHMAKKLEQTLKEGEAALLFLSEHHRLQFPEGVQVFYVAPPALDEVRRWQRDYREKMAREEEEAGRPAQQAGEEGQPKQPEGPEAETPPEGPAREEP